MNFVTGQPVQLSAEGRTVDAEVELASSNGVSLMLKFDAGVWIADGMYAGRMAVLRGPDGVYRDLLNDYPVSIKARP